MRVGKWSNETQIAYCLQGDDGDTAGSYKKK